MALFEYITEFQSALPIGRQQSLNKMIERVQAGELPVSESSLQNMLDNSLSPVTSTSGVTSSIGGYNNAITSIATDLGSLYAESSNLWSILLSAQNLNKQEVAKIRLAVEDLETRVRQSTKLVPSNITYTDTLLETFNAQTTIETDPHYYQNGTIPRSLIDVSDGFLKLPVDGEFTNQLSQPGIIPSNVFLDRTVGLPVGEGHLPSEAFDGTDVNFWNETLHAESPIYASQNLFPWLPNTYAGGAACRVKIELERTTQISELDIRPYGQHAFNLLAVAYTNELENSLTDPTFTQGVSGSPCTNWYKNVTDGDIVLQDAAGPDGQVVAYLTTNSATGRAILQHGYFSMSGAGLEFSFLAKTLGDTPIEVGVTCWSSGNIPLSDRIETLTLDSLGWTKVITSFDPAPGTVAVSIRIGIPVFNKRKSELWLCDLRGEVIKELIFTPTLYKKIDKRTTVFLPASIDAKRLYLIFSQENYTFKHYSLADGEYVRKTHWERLSRRVTTSPQILSWDMKATRDPKLRMPATSNLSYFSDPSILRPIQGTSWDLLSQIEQYAFPSTSQSSFPVYEYEIGAFEIYLRHREYASRSRYVSLPIKLNGEIREIKLQAVDRVYKDLSEITYMVTLSADDSPEKAKILTNSSMYTQDLSRYPSPPTTIDIMDYTSWVTTATSSAFTPLSNPYPREYPRLNQSIMIAITSDAVAGLYIQKSLEDAIDLRGAASLNFDYYLYTDPNNFSGREILPSWKFSLGISKDGVVWNEKEFEITPIRGWNLTANFQPVFSSLSFDIQSISSSGKLNIKFLRLTCKSPTGVKLPYGLFFTNLRTAGYNSGKRSLRIWPSDDLPNNQTLTSDDFILPIQHKFEDIDGSDRYGRVFISEYPYLNRTKIMDLVSTLSQNLSGRRVNYDPNALKPKYIDSNFHTQVTEGYRPIAVTLYFKDQNITALPDILGTKKKGDVGESISELLTITRSELITSSQQFVDSFKVSGISPVKTAVEDTPVEYEYQGFGNKVKKSKDGTVTKSAEQISADRNRRNKMQQSQQSSSKSQLLNTVRVDAIYQSRYRNIISGPQGVAITCYWASGTTDNYFKLSQIDPLKVSVDADQGLVRVVDNTAPSGYIGVIADYYYVIGEESPREHFNFSDIISTGTASGTSLTYPQRYPVTRNMTDYTTGIIPTLKVPVMDPLEPDYYPVFEYYCHPDGYLVFSENLHQFSDTPAYLKIEYDTLAVTPRIIIDMTRPDKTNQTPIVDEFQIYWNLRRS